MIEEKNNFHYNSKFIRLIYLICKEVGTDQWFDGGRFQTPEDEPNTIESACQRIVSGTLLAQRFFQHTVGQSFRLESNNDQPIVYRFIINGFNNVELWKLNQLELWRLVANQLMNSDLASKQCKYLAFCSFSRFDPDETKSSWMPSKQVKGYVSLGGNDLALLSTHCLYTWPKTIEEIETRLKDDRLVDSKKFMNDSDNRNTRSGCFATTLGAMIHELAHTFDLGHRTEGIMGRKFNQINEFFFDNNPNQTWWTFEDLIILKSNCWFRSIGPTYTSKQDFSLYHQILHSKHGLRLIEYRHHISNLVFDSKIFDKPIKVYKISNGKCNLFALDYLGNTRTFRI